MMGKAALWLLLTTLSASAVSPVRPPPPPQPTPTEASAANDAIVGPAKQQLAAGAYAQAIEAAAAGIGAEQSPATRAVAWTVIAEALASTARPHAAAAAFAIAFEADLNAALPSLASANEAARRTGDTTRFARAIAKNPGLAADGETRDQVAVLAARQLVQQGELALALAFIARIDARGPEYASAEALRGVVLSLRGEHGDAVGPFVTAHTLASQASVVDQRQVDLLALNTARAFYASGNIGQAMTWFAMVGRGSPWWPEAQYERAWAHFRVDDVTGTLALLHTLEAPYFDDWYFPEATLLRAYALFMLCKFPDASKTMDRFVERYGPMQQQLDSALGKLDAKGAWADLLAYRRGDASQLPVAVLRPLALSERTADAERAIVGLESELSSIASATKGVRDALAAHASAMREAEGKYVLDQAVASRVELDSLLTNIELSRIDLLTLEADLLQQASVTGEVPRAAVRDKLKDLRKTRKGWRIWPWEGEYWADELGWYRIDSPSSCPANLSGGR